MIIIAFDRKQFSSRTLRRLETDRETTMSSCRREGNKRPPFPWVTRREEIAMANQHNGLLPKAHPRTRTRPRKSTCLPWSEQRNAPGLFSGTSSLVLSYWSNLLPEIFQRWEGKKIGLEFRHKLILSSLDSSRPFCLLQFYLTFFLLFTIYSFI